MDTLGVKIQSISRFLREGNHFQRRFLLILSSGHAHTAERCLNHDDLTIGKCQQREENNQPRVIHAWYQLKYLG